MFQNVLTYEMIKISYDYLLEAFFLINASIYFFETFAKPLTVAK